MDIQLLVVLVISATAIFYLGRKFVLQIKGKEKPGCEKCEPADKKTVKK